MKKFAILILLLSLYLNILAPSSFAISPTPTKRPTPTPSPGIIQKQINSLTNKIASRVAELRLVEKKGVMGQVSDVSSTQITISDIHGNTKFVDVDEFTKFNSTDSKSSFGISDIKKGDKLGILGLYNKESRRILARFVDVIDLPRVLHGKISEIDEKNFTFILSDDKDKSTEVNVESSTRTFAYDKNTKELARSGFSKLVVGQRIAVIGYPDKSDADLFQASRIVIARDISEDAEGESESPGRSTTPTEAPEE